MKLNETDTRERLLAYVSLVRTALAVNPKTPTSQLCTVAGVGRRSSLHLAELGVIAGLPDGAGSKWESRASDAEVVDMLIAHRRKQEPTLPPSGLPELLSEFDRRLGDVAQAASGLRGRVEALETASPKTVELGTEDRELLNLALTDRSNLAARVDDVERLLGNLLRVQAGAAARAEPAAAPAVQKKWRVLVLGVFQRDTRHVYDAVEAALKGSPLAVKLEFVSPEDRRAVSVIGIDAVFYTQEADNRVRETLRNCLVPLHRVAGGNKAVAEAVVTFVRGVKP